MDRTHVHLWTGGYEFLLVNLSQTVHLSLFVCEQRDCWINFHEHFWKCRKEQTQSTRFWVWPGFESGSQNYLSSFMWNMRNSTSPLLLLWVIVRPLSTVGYTSVAASVIHSRQWANYLNSWRHWRLSKRKINTLLAGCVHSSVNKPREWVMTR